MKNFSLARLPRAAQRSVIETWRWRKISLYLTTESPKGLWNQYQNDLERKLCSSKSRTKLDRNPVKESTEEGGEQELSSQPQTYFKAKCWLVKIWHSNRLQIKDWMLNLDQPVIQQSISLMVWTHLQQWFQTFVQFSIVM